jgi:outer membrane protein W
MLRKLIGLSALALILVPVSTASADHHEDFPGLDAGTWELTLTGSGTSNQDADAGNAALQVSLGYFIFDQFELLARQGVGYNDNDNLTGGGTSVTASTAVAVDYHFDLDRFQPFIGAGIGYNYGDSDVDETLFAGPEAGIKWFVKDDTFLYGLVQYQWFFDNVEDIEDNTDDGSFLYAVGIGFTW